MECLKDGYRKGVTNEGVKDIVERAVQDQLLRFEPHEQMKQPKAIRRFAILVCLEGLRSIFNELNFLIKLYTRQMQPECE